MSRQNVAAVNGWVTWRQRLSPHAKSRANSPLPWRRSIASRGHVRYCFSVLGGVALVNQCDDVTTVDQTNLIFLNEVYIYFELL